jgi:hypothetical protein
LAFGGSSNLSLRTDYIKGTYIHTVTNISVLSQKKEACPEINNVVVNTLIQEDSRTYYSVDSVNYEDNLGDLSEQYVKVDFTTA